MQTAHPAGNDLRSVLRAAAALHGIYSEADLAREVRVGKGTLQRWWEGSVPSAEVLGRLAAAVEMPEGELLRLARGERVVYQLVPAEADDELATMRQQIAELQAAIRPERLQSWASSERQPSRPRPPARPPGTGRP